MSKTLLNMNYKSLMITVEPLFNVPPTMGGVNVKLFFTVVLLCLLANVRLMVDLDTWLVVILLEVSVVTLDLPIGPIQIHFVLEPVPRCEPSIYQPINRLGL